MNAKQLFDAVRSIKGSALTPADVHLVNLALSAPAVAAPAPAQGGGPDPELIAQLKIDEGLRLRAYKDTVGVWTIGYGHAYIQPGTVWTQAQAEAQLIKDVAEHNADLDRALPWIKDLDPVRRRVLYNMHFNMGWDNPRTPEKEGLSGFVNTLAFIKAGAYDRAADGMLASKWARQVGQRAKRLAAQMRTGR